MSAKEHYWRMMDIADAFAKSTCCFSRCSNNLILGGSGKDLAPTLNLYAP